VRCPEAAEKKVEKTDQPARVMYVGHPQHGGTVSVLAFGEEAKKLGVALTGASTHGAVRSNSARVRPVRPAADAPVRPQAVSGAGRS
jgi:hypothetical protein